MSYDPLDRWFTNRMIWRSPRDGISKSHAALRSQKFTLLEWLHGKVPISPNHPHISSYLVDQENWTNNRRVSRSTRGISRRSITLLV